MSRNHVQPPDAALSPNTAPGRAFFDDQFRGEDPNDGITHEPPTAITPDLTKPNLTRIAMSDQLYTQFLNAGNDAVTARALADARALQMIP